MIIREGNDVRVSTSSTAMHSPTPTPTWTSISLASPAKAPAKTRRIDTQSERAAPVSSMYYLRPMA